MKSKQSMRRVMVTLSMASAVMGACGGTGEDKGIEAAQGGNESTVSAAASDPQSLAAQIGVEPGPVQRTEGAAAVLALSEGQVEVRRLGEETFASVKINEPLYLGDQVRVLEDARATLLFADESTAELAELSTLSVGSRAVTADPASSAALLSGVARFSVAPRAPGEGPFMVYTPAGVVATKGTVFGVGVAADGDARVGVESGEVEIAGAVTLDAPVTLEANAAADLLAAGTVAAPKPWPTDDWGTWRAEAEADLDVAATAALHADAMAALSAELDASYAALANLGTQVSTFEASAAVLAGEKNSASYEAQLPEANLAIDASFLVGLRLEFLTHAYAAHAALASELYLRHPQVVAWGKLEPRVEASVLWPKRFDAMAVAYFEPLRVQYYLHHPRGRAHAKLVGIAVPEFYASVTPPAINANARAKFKFKVFTPPHVACRASGRAVWIAAPSANWHGKAKLKGTAPRGKLAFWVRPPNLKGKAILGARVQGKIKPSFAVRPAKARGELKAKWGIALGQHIRIAAPDLKTAAEARLAWKGELAAPSANTELEADVDMPDVHGKAKGHAKGHAKLVGDAKAKAGAHADAAAHAKGKAKADASAKVKVKGPEIKAPKLKAGAKGSASFKL